METLKIDSFPHLSTSAEADDVKVGEDPEEQLPGQPPVDESLIVLGEDPGDLPLGDPHLNWVTIPIPKKRDIFTTSPHMIFYKLTLK